jgi:hypothetical protein
MSSLNSMYDQTQVENILAAYRGIFPSITPELDEYWGLARTRSWSVLTSDFHSADYGKYKALHERVLAIDEEKLDAHTKGGLLRKSAMDHGLGFSIGLSAWTDHLLYQTYSDDKDEVVVLLGHDWYPIVSANRSWSDAPLRTTDNLALTERYCAGAPQAIFDGSSVGLFFNFYPDYRPPGAEKCGSLRGYGYSYAECLTGLDAVIDSLARRFKTIRLISWGANVWGALVKRVASVPPKSLIKSHISGNPGKILKIELAGREVDYLPIIHPSFWVNFGADYHLYHVNQGFTQMGLGQPGPADSCAFQVVAARQAKGPGNDPRERGG